MNFNFLNLNLVPEMTMRVPMATIITFSFYEESQAEHVFRAKSFRKTALGYVSLDQKKFAFQYGFGTFILTTPNWSHIITDLDLTALIRAEWIAQFN